MCQTNVSYIWPVGGWFARFGVACWLLAFALPSLSLAANATSGLTERRSNILFILADDLGWSDTTLFGTTDYYETPNIRRLRDRGMLFTNAHTASPVCTPTRASIMTGRYPARYGLTQARGHLAERRFAATLANDARPTDRAIQLETATRLPSQARTLAEALHDAGYRTAHFGKWHLGDDEGHNPLDQGFDLAVPKTASGMIDRSYFAPWGLPEESARELPAQPGEHAEDRMVCEAVAFIEENAKAERAFFLNYGAFSVHSPWSAKADLTRRFAAQDRPLKSQRNPVYAAMVAAFDEAVGRLLEAIDRSDLAENTIIVFFSDNGGNTWAPPRTEPDGYAHIPGTSNAPLRAGKGSLYEGGTRVPLAIIWPGRVVPGSESDALFGSTDFFPTLLEMCGLSPEPGTHLDGVSQVPALLGHAGPRHEFFTYYPHRSGDPWASPAVAVHVGGWKLIRWFCDNPDQTDRLELFHLQTDIAEVSNQANRWPDRTQNLSRRLDTFLASLGQPQPEPNPHYLGALRIER